MSTFADIVNVRTVYQCRTFEHILIGGGGGGTATTSTTRHPPGRSIIVVPLTRHMQCLPRSVPGPSPEIEGPSVQMLVLPDGGSSSVRKKVGVPHSARVQHGGLLYRKLQTFGDGKKKDKSKGAESPSNAEQQQQQYLRFALRDAIVADEEAPSGLHALRVSHAQRGCVVMQFKTLWEKDRWFQAIKSAVVATTFGPAGLRLVGTQLALADFPAMTQLPHTMMGSKCFRVRCRRTGSVLCLVGTKKSTVADDSALLGGLQRHRRLAPLVSSAGPNVVSLVAAFQTDRSLYYVETLLEGPAVDTLVSRGNLAAAAWLYRNVAEGLHQCHGCGVGFNGNVTLMMLGVDHEGRVVIRSLKEAVELPQGDAATATHMAADYSALASLVLCLYTGQSSATRGDDAACLPEPMRCLAVSPPASYLEACSSPLFVGPDGTGVSCPWGPFSPPRKLAFPPPVEDFGELPTGMTVSGWGYPV
eukprot:PhM_4_TR14354/c0_g1_i1/m.36419